MFNHKQDKKDLLEKINNYLKDASQEQIELAYKFIEFIFESQWLWEKMRVMSIDCEKILFSAAGSIWIY